MTTKVEKKLTNKDFIRVYWRAFFHESSFTWERMQALGIAWTLTPIIKKFYGDNPEEFKKACIRHTQFFNVTVQICNFIVGIVLALEEQNVNSDEDLDTLISTAKTALMGPMSAIGDTFYWGTFKIIATSVGCAMCLEGNPLGVVAFILLYNIPHWVLRWVLLKLGYRIGGDFVSVLSTGGVIDRLTKAAYIIGLSVSGAMTANYIKISTPLKFMVGDSEVVVQEIFDSILLGALPLASVFLFAYFMRVKNVKPMTLMIIALIVGYILGFLGILG